MKEEDIQIANIIFEKMYKEMGTITVNISFCQTHGSNVQAGESFLRLSRLIRTTGYADVLSTECTDTSFKCNLTQQGLLMMAAYGSFEECIKDMRIKRRSDLLMYWFTVVVAIATILSSMANVYVAFFKG